jgi:enoyl-CoA hydratase/carnithine racemase
MTAAPSIEVEDHGPARVIILCRPEKRNALSREVATTLAIEVERAAADESVRGIVLAAKGPVFAAGGDLAEFQQLLDKKGGAEEVLAMGRRMREIERAPVPVIAAVTGHVFGGGCELLLLCDGAFVERGTTLQFRHAEMGLAPAWGASVRLVERVGPLQAMRLLGTAEIVDADEAASLGLATKAVEPGEALAASLQFVARAARLGRDAVAAQKRAIMSARRDERERAEEREAEVFRSMWGAPAHRAAMEAFAARGQRRSGGQPPGSTEPG